MINSEKFHIPPCAFESFSFTLFLTLTFHSLMYSSFFYDLPATSLNILNLLYFFYIKANSFHLKGTYASFMQMIMVLWCPNKVLAPCFRKTQALSTAGFFTHWFNSPVLNSLVPLNGYERVTQWWHHNLGHQHLRSVGLTFGSYNEGQKKKKPRQTKESKCGISQCMASNW